MHALAQYTSQHVISVAMTRSHSIVAPRYPWGVKNKSVMRSVPDPSFLCEGAGTQTTPGGSMISSYRTVRILPHGKYDMEYNSCLLPRKQGSVVNME